MSIQREGYKPPTVSTPKPESEVPGVEDASQTLDAEPGSQAADAEAQAAATSNAPVMYGMEPSFYRCADCNTVFKPAITDKGTVIWKCRECGNHTVHKLPTKK